MNEEVKEKVRPIYEELKGYLAQCPPVDKAYYLYNSYYWTQIEGCIQQLNEITGKDYSKFKITLIPSRNRDGEHIENSEYRSKVNGLIMNLKGTYFNDDNPFGGSPMVSVNQTQTVQVTMAVEITEMISKQLYGENAKNLKPEEKSFLEKVKAALPTIKSAAELLALVIKTAQASGLDIHTAASALGLA